MIIRQLLADELRIYDSFILDLTRKYKLYLAGGALRKLVDKSDTISDYDLFFSELHIASRVRTELENDGYKLTYACPLGLLYSYKKKGGWLNKTEIKVQLVTEHEYKSANDLISCFDFTACAASIDYNGTFICHDDFEKHVREKELVINKLEYPVATMKRMFKYHDKGYNISLDTITNFIEMSSNMENENPNKWRNYID